MRRGNRQLTNSPTHRRSILRHRRIDVVAPSEDAAGEVPHALEPRRLELPHRLRAPAAHLARHDDVARAVERGELLGERAERHEPRTRDLGDRPLVRLPHVDQIEVVATTQLLRELDSARDVVLYCKSGARSAKALRQLQAAGFKRVWNLAGGILRWSDEVDPSIPKY